MDFIDLPSSLDGFKHVFHIIDYFTRFSQSWPTKNAKSESVVSCLSEFLRYLPTPSIIYHDGGRHFTSSTTQTFLADRRIRSITSPSGHSQAAGMIERANGLLQRVLRTMADSDVDHWPDYLADATRALNTRIASPHGFSPIELLFGSAPTITTPTSAAHLASSSRLILSSLPSHNQLEGERLLHILHREEKLSEAFLRQAETYPGPTSPRRRLGLGDLVAVYIQPRKSEKLAPRWRGPFVIVEARHRTYRLAHIWSDRAMPGRFDIHHLRLFHKRPERLGPVPALTAPKTLRPPRDT